jgi:hypothetical protein
MYFTVTCIVTQGESSFTINYISRNGFFDNNLTYIKENKMKRDEKRWEEMRRDRDIKRNEKMRRDESDESKR